MRLASRVGAESNVKRWLEFYGSLTAGTRRHTLHRVIPNESKTISLVHTTRVNISYYHKKYQESMKREAHDTRPEIVRFIDHDR